MLTPEEIQKIADTMFPLLDELNGWILRDMIRRLMARLARGEGPLLTATDEWQAQVYQEAGGHLEAVQREIQRFLQASDEEVARIFEDAAIRSLEADNRVYVRAGGRERVLSPSVMRVLTDTYQRTNGTIHNFTRSTATASQRKLIRLLDKAHMMVMTGAQSYTAAVSDAAKEISGAQAQVIYPTGHIDTIETAVLRAVRTGTAQATGNMTLVDIEERDWDLIRVSAHIGARYGDGGENPGNHFWWQGKLYSRSGQDKRYPPFVESTGYGTGEGLCGWNCRHSFGPGDPNHNPYKDFDAEENKRVYDLSQRQREMERNIRHTKTKLIVLREGIEAAQNDGVKAELEREYARTAKLLEARNKAYNDFCSENGLKRLSDRLEVAKWTRADAKKSIMAAKQENIPKNGLANEREHGIMRMGDGIMQTGGREMETGGKHYAPPTARDFQAAEEYRKISRVNDTEIIAKNSGFSVKDVVTIKRHIFFEKHKTYDGYELLQPDYDMAVAWNRLKDGKPEERDILLLHHELLESQIEKERNCTLAEAHAAAQEVYNWSAEMDRIFGEDGGEPDGLL